MIVVGQDSAKPPLLRKIRFFYDPKSRSTRSLSHRARTPRLSSLSAKMVRYNRKR